MRVRQVAATLLAVNSQLEIIKVLGPDSIPHVWLFNYNFPVLVAGRSVHGIGDKYKILYEISGGTSLGPSFAFLFH